MEKSNLSLRLQTLLPAWVVWETDFTTEKRYSSSTLFCNFLVDKCYKMGFCHILFLFLNWRLFVGHAIQLILFNSPATNSISYFFPFFVALEVYFLLSKYITVSFQLIALMPFLSWKTFYQPSPLSMYSLLICQLHSFSVHCSLHNQACAGICSGNGNLKFDLIFVCLCL